MPLVIEFSDGSNFEYQPSDLDAVPRVSKNTSRVRLYELMRILPGDKRQRVHGGLVDGLPASLASGEVDLHSAEVVTLLLRPTASGNAPPDATRMNEYIYRDRVRPAVPTHLKDSASDAVSGLLRAFSSGRPKPAASDAPIVPLQVVTRLVKHIALDEAAELKTLMEESKKVIAKKKKKRAKKAAREAAQAAGMQVQDSTMSFAGPPAPINHAELREELKAKAFAAGADGVLAMGFGEHVTVRAMLENELNPELAANFIVTLPDLGASMDEPLSDELVEKYAAKHLPDRMRAMQHPSNGSMARQASSAGAIFMDDADSDDEPPAPVDPKVQQLVEMGFDATQAERALGEFRGNLEAAANALLEGRTFDAPAVLEGERPWPLRLQERLYELEHDAATANPPSEPTMTPDSVVETAAAVLDASRIPTARREEPYRTVLREISKLFPADDAAPAPEAVPSVSSTLAALASQLGGLAANLDEVGGGLIEEEEGTVDGSGDHDDDAAMDSSSSSAGADDGDGGAIVMDDGPAQPPAADEAAAAAALIGAAVEAGEMGMRQGSIGAYPGRAAGDDDAAPEEHGFIDVDDGDDA